MPTVEAVTSQLSRLMLKFNGYGKDGQQGGSDEDDDLAMSRPFGVSLLLAGLGRGRPVLFHLEPSGEHVGRVQRQAICFATITIYGGTHENAGLSERLANVTLRGKPCPKGEMFGRSFIGRKQPENIAFSIFSLIRM